MIKEFKNICNKIKNKILKRLFKLLLSKLFFLLVILNQNAFSKPLPPGSGAGDTPANILILLDTSQSMSHKPFGGEAMSYPGGIVLLDDGDILVGMSESGGIVKFDYSTEMYDVSFADGEKNFYGTNNDSSCSLDSGEDSRVSTMGYMDVSKKVSGQGTNEIIYAIGLKTGKVVGIDTDGNCINVISKSDLGFSKGGVRKGKDDRIYPLAMDIVTKDSNDIMVVTGQYKHCTSEKKKKKKWICNGSTFTPFWYSKNLTTQSNEGTCDISARSSDLQEKIRKINSLQIEASGDKAYFIEGGRIWRYPLTLGGDGLYCPSTDDNALKSFTSGTSGSDFAAPFRIQFDPESATTMYLTSSIDHKLQKLTISDDKIVTTDIEIGGSFSASQTPASAADSALSADINLYSPGAIFVSDDRVWIAGKKISIQEFDISGDSIQWVDEMGSSKISRAKGAAIAIKKIVTDSTLTQGARFGYGWWNAGTVKGKKGKAKWLWCKQCEYTCNKECPCKGCKKHQDCNDNCNYYKGWAKGSHPVGQSKQCDTSSCLKVGIGKNNAQEIIDAIDDMDLEFGTDAQAFAQLGLEYFEEFQDELTDITIPCLINYVIVIGDGEWRHQTEAIKKIKILRETYKVKTLFIAYGGGISARGMSLFDEIAIAGSCNKAGDADCKETIVADDPAALLTKLKSEVERIIASRLSFSAPSISANIQGDGDLYQAQFEYKQHGEWTGHLIRKKINQLGKIEHDLDKGNNWDAAAKVKFQAEGDTRKIWTALENADYKDLAWNNFSTTYKSNINNLFRILGNTVPDYHNTSSNCAGEEGADGIVADGNSDDILGLIKFVRGYDYFAYEGCKNINKVRSSVLGDIYHSQLVEVGKPSANTFFTGTNQEAYWRSINNYEGFARDNENRQRVIYAGANDGMLHAFDATEEGDGKELWAFVPPFIAGRLPELVNEALDGMVGDRGGTNSIFAVDGSPVIHDMYIRGIKDGEWETNKSWHTILFIAYGRGGNGFSVLDVTNPEEPHHMFSVYNDKEAGKILVAERNGKILNSNEVIEGMTYASGSYHVTDSLEALRAEQNEQAAYDIDIAADDTGNTTDQRDTIATCQTNSDASSGTFRIDGTGSCYKGTTFTFKADIPQSIVDDIGKLDVASDDTLSVKSFTQDGPLATITFTNERVFNLSGSPETDLEGSNSFRINLPAEVPGDQIYDYSKLGETWANPRIIRMPVDGDYRNDIYVAVLPGGFGKSEGVGSAVFLVNLSDMKTAPGELVSAGPIEIVDLDTSITSEGVTVMPDIHNSILGDPVVITPDTFKGAKWRGAMVYVNDLEGKITKINLTSDTTNGMHGDSSQTIELFDTTTLFKLNATDENGRLSYFGMDAAFGNDTKNLWLFGSTGDFSDIGGKNKEMDNVIYGIRDRNFPNFVHLNGSDVSELASAEGANDIDNEDYCAHTHEEGIGTCEGETKDAWVFKLDRPYDKESSDDEEEDTKNTENMYRKASASPTVYKGTVYYPIYQPPTGAAACGVGNAFICSADDECGTNTSENITYAQKTVGSESRFDGGETAIGGEGAASGCYYLRPGILSRLVVFGDTLFANITTSSEEQEDTLISLLSEQGEIEVYRGSWRENY